LNVKIQNRPTVLHWLVRGPPPLAIRDEVAYRNAQQVIDALTSIPHLSKDQMQYLDTLSILFEAYENEHHGFYEYPVGPLEALRFLLEEHDMTASDLGRLLGERSLGSKILTGERRLSQAHIRALADH